MNRDVALTQPAGPAPQTARYTLLGIFFGMGFPALATALRLVQLGLPLTGTNFGVVQRGDFLLWIIDTAPIVIGFLAGLAGRQHDRLLSTNQRLLLREAELQRIQANLEGRVEDRTNQLAEKMGQLRSSSFLVRSIADVQDLPGLLDKTVQMTSDLYGLYHVGIYLFDEQGRNAFLQAASSNAGRRLVESGFYIARSLRNAVGYIAEQGKPYLQDDSAAVERADVVSEGRLPSTRSEMLVPLSLRGKVIGALDFQSDKPQAFNQDLAEILASIADQVAAAIDHLHLLEQTHVLLAQLEAITTRDTHSVWSGYLRDRNLAFQYTPTGIKPLAAGQAEPANAQTLRVPLRLRGQQIGELNFRRKEGANWTARERDLAEKVVAQVALALDNNRLLEDSRRRAAQEQTMSEISARLNRSLDVDTVLQTAARELGNLAGVAEVAVLIGEPPAGAPEA